MLQKLLDALTRIDATLADLSLAQANAGGKLISNTRARLRYDRAGELIQKFTNLRAEVEIMRAEVESGGEA